VNPRQRRGFMLLGLAFLGAIAVFVGIASYVADVRRNIRPETTVLVLTRNVDAQQPVTPDMLKSKRIPRKFVSAQAISDPTAIASRVAGQKLPKGAELQEGMLVAPPALIPGQREISVLISAETGVAGKIQPGDLVDIEATYAGDQRSVPRARTVISRAQIVTIGAPREGTSRRNFGGDAAEGGGSGGGDGAGGGNGAVVPVTFALSPQGVLILTHAESFAEQVRLALIRPGDDSRVKGKRREYTLPKTKRRAPK